MKANAAPLENKDRQDLKIPDFFRAMRQNWKLVLIVPAAFVVLAVLYLHLTNHTYSITLKVTAVTPSNNQSLSSRIGSLGALAGLSLGANLAEIPFELYLDGLHSRAAADILSNRQELMRKLYANEWNDQTQSWQEPRSLSKAIKDVIKAVLGIPVTEWTPPNGARVEEFLKLNIQVLKERESPVVSITIDLLDRQLGREVLLSLHNAVDGILRARTLKRTEGYIHYLKGQLEVVTVAEYRNALIEALAEQETNLMMALSDMSFVAEPFGEPAASQRPMNPQGTLILLFAFTIGTLIGGFLAVTVYRHER